jgi:hypothetical protein
LPLHLGVGLWLCVLRLRWANGDLLGLWLGWELGLVWCLGFCLC